ncbi:MAG: T9SS type A sorting domain-containing protein [Saprospiraceae bacterium]|nr:T9SS type A sorting domain-containing protein [Saprospiraceae bacterium]
MKTILLQISLLLLWTGILAQGNLQFKLLKEPCNCDGEIEISGINPQVDHHFNYGGWANPKIINVTGSTMIVKDYCGTPVFQVIMYDANNEFLYWNNFEPNLSFTSKVKITTNDCPVPSIAEAKVTGGAPPYTYEWIEANSLQVKDTKNPAALPDGEYYLLVKDNNGCVSYSNYEYDSGKIYIRSRVDIQLQVNSTIANCTNGTAEVKNIVGGMTPYSYLWSNGSNSVKIENLKQGQYNVIVTDSRGCNTGSYVYVSQAYYFNPQFSITNTTCKRNEGSIYAFGSGGVPPYQYQWSNGSSDQQIKNLDEGYYFVTITDSRGCFTRGYSNLSKNTPVQVRILESIPSSCTKATGSAKIQISGGSAPYKIRWNSYPPQLGDQLSNVLPGRYKFIVEDINGCSQTGDVEILPENILRPQFKVVHENCDLKDGSIEAQVSGGLAPYKFNWSTGSNNSSIDKISNGWYNLTITDSKLCQVEKFVVVEELSTLSALPYSKSATCKYVADGECGVNIVGGKAPFQYVWDGANTGLSSLKNILPGYHFVKVTDVDGCNDEKFIYVDSEPKDYCYCVVKGIVFHDKNENCIKDSNEEGIPNIQIFCDGYGYVYTNDDGEYSLDLPSGNFRFTERLETYSPLASCQDFETLVTINTKTDRVKILNFANKVNPIRDIYIGVWPNECPVPGFEYTQKMIMKNLGTVNESAILANYRNDGQLNDIQFNPTNIFKVSGNVNQFLAKDISLSKGEEKVLTIKYLVPTDMPINTALDFEDECVYESPIDNWLNDFTPWNNRHSFRDFVQSSYDPNNMEVLPQGKGLQGFIIHKDSVLEYKVNFQNLGNYHTRKVRVEITLDKNLDWKKLIPLFASSKERIEMSLNGKLTYYFDDIRLDPASSSEESSKGFLIFSVPLLKGLPVGTKIQNYADIFFDFNAPITTNLTLNTIRSLVASDNPKNDKGTLKVFPNPANEILFVEFEHHQDEIGTLELIDLLGRSIENSAIQLVAGKNSFVLHLDNVSSGYYTVKLNSKSGKIMTRRFDIVK